MNIYLNAVIYFRMQKNLNEKEIGLAFFYALKINDF